MNRWVNRGNYEFTGIGFWQSANIWAAFALKDQLSGNHANRQIGIVLLLFLIL